MIRRCYQFVKLINCIVSIVYNYQNNACAITDIHIVVNGLKDLDQCAGCLSGLQGLRDLHIRVNELKPGCATDHPDIGFKIKRNCSAATHCNPVKGKHQANYPAQPLHCPVLHRHDLRRF